VAKKLLKNQRTNLDLWNAYTQLEQSLGHISEARKIYTNSLKISQSMAEEEVRTSRPLMYQLFAELELEAKHPGKALGQHLSPCLFSSSS